MSRWLWFDAWATRSGASLRCASIAAAGDGRSGTTPPGQYSSFEHRRQRRHVLDPAPPVGPGRDAVLRAAGHAEVARQVVVRDGEHDALVVRTRHAAGPHRVAVAAVLEHAQFGDQQPAVRRRHLQALRSGPDEVDVEVDRVRHDTRLRHHRLYDDGAKVQ